MAKRKKRIGTVTRKLGILINCRVQKPFLKDLDATENHDNFHAPPPW